MNPSAPSTSLRPARPDELERVYRMGFDAWGGEATLGEFLTICRDSRKYARGRWFVRCDALGVPRSSALVHDFEPWDDWIVRGIGSVATDPGHRRRGQGTALVEALVEQLTSTEGAAVVFLYSDIGAGFYAKLGFTALDDHHQSAPGSVMMQRLSPDAPDDLIERYAGRLPSYF